MAPPARPSSPPSPSPFASAPPVASSPFAPAGAGPFAADAANPYTSPATLGPPAFGPGGVYGGQLASRWVRLGGRLLDSLIIILAMVPGILVFIPLAVAADRGGPGAGAQVGAFFSIVVMFGGAIAVVIVNWVMISNSGQSIGKKIVGTRIVKIDTGEPPGFLYGVVLREWVISLIGAIPYLGACINFIGILLIFGEERRCLHDYIASTRVVVA
jgi:uncharacterized RDD family membrane protein YckC